MTNTLAKNLFPLAPITRKMGHPVRSRMSVRRLTAIIILLSCAFVPVVARAGLVVEVIPSNLNVSVPPGYSGTLEVDLVNPVTDTQSYSVGAFQFELRVPSGSGVLFSDATTATTTASYIFSGSGFADLFYGGSLITSSPPPPTNDLLASDLFAIPSGSVALAPGDVVGLGFVSFTVSANASTATVPLSIITFDASSEPNGTQILDPNGSLLGFSSSDGAIMVQGQSTPAVPEPATLTMMAVGVSCAVGIRVGKRANRLRTCRVSLLEHRSGE